MKISICSNMDKTGGHYRSTRHGGKFSWDLNSVCKSKITGALKSAWVLEHECENYRKSLSNIYFSVNKDYTKHFK